MTFLSSDAKAIDTEVQVIVLEIHMIPCYEYVQAHLSMSFYFFKS